MTLEKSSLLLLAKRQTLESSEFSIHLPIFLLNYWQCRFELLKLRKFFGGTKHICLKGSPC
ncbi:hypothetical protein ACOSQ4_000991 [Xanthoceras sorbifolium]